MDARFEQVRVLGRGSHGEAALVRDRSTGELVVAKTILAKQCSVFAEVEVLRGLQHPNIVKFVDCLVDAGGEVVLVMEYASGGDLQTYIAGFNPSQWIPEAHVVRILVQLCLALKHLHERNILHRDIKPHNIFLTAAGVVKLGDFGIAKALESPLALAQTQIGTPLSPEICQGLEYDAKSDMWSLGCVLHEMLTLSPPFQARSWPLIVSKILDGAPSPVIASDRYSPELIDLASLLLSKLPVERPSTTDILSMPFIQAHIFSLVSVATWNQLPPLQGVPNTSQASKPPAVQTHRSLLDALNGSVGDQGIEHQGRHGQANVGHPEPIVMANPLEEAARKQYYENQRAARVYKERMDQLRKGTSFHLEPLPEAVPTEPSHEARRNEYAA
ncbi:CAMK family protein kinase [Achlya hypogyna]|uniref:non-specific serine/threonine protein kinase n=1 Tax=Achlya hypogyna TaxID=1202772 RepID=A0A1V9YF06_ACHHY|nr:CAMK family protein kinase [Achlya hypogyna]